MRKIFVTTVLSIISLLCFAQLRQININGAKLNYIDSGRGEAIVFVHGSLEDYTTWLPQIERLSRQYRVIAYSRRYNFPNKNKLSDVKSFSPATEAADLYSLIKALKLGKVHLVGHSYGGLTSLVFADKHPEFLRSLTLSEPANIEWLKTLEGGDELFSSFYNDLWKPVRTSFLINDSVEVLRQTLKFFAGEDLVDKLPAEVISQVKQSLGEWYVEAFSPKAFAGVKKGALKKIKVPVFILTAGQTLPVLQPLNKELIRLLPNASHFHLEEATHDYWVTHADILGNELLAFINNQK